MLRISPESSPVALKPYSQRQSPNPKSSMHIKEEHTSSDEWPTKQRSKTGRHRASVACTSCRDRRIRCVVPSGTKRCMQCERSNTSCIIKDDDERRRPISRVYVNSLVERVALLERMLKGQGLTAPPADYPPKTRHYSCRSKDASSSDGTSLSPSTPPDSSMSDGHIASSPCSSDHQIKDENQITGSKKRLSIYLDVDDGGDHSSKRTRHDSLIAPLELRAEAFSYNRSTLTSHYNEEQNLSNFMTIPPFDQDFLWPIAQNHSNDETIHCPAGRVTNTNYPTQDAWSNDGLNLQRFSSHTLNMQYGETLHVEPQYDVSSTPGRPLTNLDFMPLSTST